MKPNKPRNVAASNRAKLLALAHERKEDFQFLLGRWVVERFLFRLSQSVRYSEQLLNFPHEVVMSVCRPDHGCQR